ncbi:hypothetical protein ASE98_00120 [Pseudomonas sp. Leaf48]|uniref:hypothetical protein n=1 Tax=Pseudomonas sp. Leaf48 TaxID=1736221 RepID=UPI000724BDE0|nr:hypothetical protein [Pseudomonas sp. Leaf48]KQN55862.1 hypothetical protein ASE98_00120 [Pseudomonas sp. Leaf48]
MRGFLIPGLIAMLFIQLNAWARDPYVDINETMCVEGEDIYISCAFDVKRSRYDYIGKVASICAKGNTSPDAGYVQYRFGKPSYGSGQAKIEMQFPEKRVPPKEIFTIYTSVNSETIGSALRFVSGKYLYSFERSSMLGYEVVVRKQDEKVFNKSCTLPGVSYLVDGAYQGIQTIDLGQKKIPGANKCSGIGLREAYSSMELDRVNACIVYTKTNLQADAHLFRETDGISLYSVVSSENPTLVYEFPYLGAGGVITDAFFLPVGDGGEELLFVVHRMEMPKIWDPASDIYDVSVFRLEADTLTLEKKLTRFFHLGGDEVDKQGGTTYEYPYKDKKSVQKTAASPLFQAILAGKVINGSIIEKTSLYEGGLEPLLQYAPKMYLIKGDKVLVEDSWGGWCKVSYQAKVEIITKWVQCKSINFSAS